MFGKLLFFGFVLVFVTSDEYQGSERKARLFSFNTVDDDIRVGLEFSIPFLTIPVKKSFDDTFSTSFLDFPTININPATLALGGAVVLGTTILVPWILKSFAQQYPIQRYSKLLNEAEFDADITMDFVNHVMESRSLHGCALRVACWTGQSAHTNELMGIWNQVMSNKLLSILVNSTAVEEAMISGRKGRDCHCYTPCPLQKNHLPFLLKNIARLTNPSLF